MATNRETVAVCSRDETPASVQTLLLMDPGICYANFLRFTQKSNNRFLTGSYHICINHRDLIQKESKSLLFT